MTDEEWMKKVEERLDLIEKGLNNLYEMVKGNPDQFASKPPETAPLERSFIGG